MRFNLIPKIIFLLLLLLIQPLGYAQDKKKENKKKAAKVGEQIFSGQLKNQDNSPLAGVTVEVQERDRVTTTGEDGKFSIKAEPNDVLIFKKDGYLTEQLVLDATADLNVVLEKAKIDAGEEDDVEIPFGTRKKRQITAAITSIKAEGLPQLPVADVKNVFSGRVSGLYLNQTGTQPGNDGTGFQVRGRSSYNGAGTNTNARALVDGVQREFNDMDQNEIESITVLKDAASLAWYGLRGGNGVVLITTRRGNPTRNSIRFDVQGGVQTPQHIIKPLNSYQFATLYNEALINDGAAPIYDQTDLDAYQNGTDPYRYPNNNYIADYLKKASPVQRYVLSADGGNSNVRYFALLSYYNQGGLFKGTKSDDYDSNIGFKKFNFRGNIDFTVNKNLTITLNAGGRAENRLYPGGNGTENTGANSLLNLLYNTPPNAFPILNEDGSYGGTSQFQTNPLGQIRDRGYLSAIDRVLLASINVKQKLDFWAKGLSANLLFSYDANGTYSSGLNRDYQVYDFTRTTPAVFRNETPLGYRTAQFTNNNRRNEIWAGLDYDRSFGLHTVNASFRGQRFVNASPERLDLRGQGLAARLDYSFKQTYYLSLVAGYSGSENYPRGKRYGFFPAVSAGWVVSEERFLALNPVLSYLKLRASHGSSGNDQIGGNRFPFETFYARNPTGGGYVFGTGFSASNSANESSLGNPDITWETITTTNVGADIRFFNNALSLSTDLYKNRRSNILTVSAIPSILGQNFLVNGGIVDSKGIETALNYDKQMGPFTLSFNGNILLSTDKVIAQNGQTGLPEYQQSIGKVAGGYAVYLSDGFFQNQEQINNSPVQTLAGKEVPGDIKYKDVGGPDGQPDGFIDALDWVRINKRAEPNTYYGFGTTIRFKLIDLSAQFMGVAGRTIITQGLINTGPFALNQESLQRWTPETAATAKYPRLGISDRGNNTAPSDFWLQNADYLKLKFLEVGLNLPQSLATKYRMQSARLYVNAFNPLTFTRLNLDVDPEVPNAGRADDYPYLKTWTIGLSAKF